MKEDRKETIEIENKIYSNENKIDSNENKSQISYDPKSKIIKENSLSTDSESSELKKNISIKSNKKNKKKKTEIFWIDENNEKNNKKYFDVFKKIQYKPNYFKEFDIKFIQNVSKSISEIKKVDFKYCYIIISGKFFQELVNTIKNEINNLKFIPIILIFTSKEYEKILLEKIPDKFTEPEMYDLINHPFFNFGGIYHKAIDILTFIKNFEISIENLRPYNGFDKPNFQNCYIFERILNPKNLILPTLYFQLSNENNKISQKDIKTFLEFLVDEHYKKNVDEIIIPLSKLSNVPYELLAKIFMRIYTSDSYFYYKMNNYLMKNKQDKYSTFIKMLYKGLELNSLKSNYDCHLYRGALISEIEFKRLQNNLKNKKEGLPSSILYSRAFLSFSKKKEEINKKFLKEEKNDKSLITVIFQVNPNKKDNVINHPSNADLNNISFYSKEEEVVFFPFSSFCIDNITEAVEERTPSKQEKEENKSDSLIKTHVYIITLEYLGKYEYVVKEELKTIDAKEYLTNLKEDKFYNEVMNSRNPLDDDVLSEKTNVSSSIDLEEFEFSNSLKNIMELNKTIIYINLNEKIEEKEKPKIKYSNALMLNENYYCFSKQNEILVFNKKENKNVISIKDSNDDEDDFINYLSKTKNERIVSCCFNYKIKIIKLNFINYSFFIEQRLEGHNLLISKIIELNDGRLCSCSFDGTIKLWRMNENRMYEKEKNLFFREKKIFFSILEMNKIFVSLLKDTNENNWIYIIYEDKINDPIMISNNNLNIKKDNLIKFNDDEFLVGGNKKIFLYNIKGENVKEIKISINVCVGLRLKNNCFLFGGNKGEIVGLENIDDNKYFIEETTSHNKEIISLSENDNCDIISRGLDRIKLFSLKLK